MEFKKNSFKPFDIPPVSSRKMRRFSAALCFSLSAVLAGAYRPPARGAVVGAMPARSASTPVVVGRRAALEAVALAGAAAALSLAGLPSSVSASGGATAGKYTTIPVAKRRYFGRVKEGVYEFLAMEKQVKAGNFKADDVTNFFAQNIVTTSKRQKRTCSGSDACTVQEERTSRWEDLQFTMFLLGNAFRLDSGKPPEKVKQVKEAQGQVGRIERALPTFCESWRARAERHRGSRSSARSLCRYGRSAFHSGQGLLLGGGADAARDAGGQGGGGPAVLCRRQGCARS
jgi:hypothetical protein